MFGREKPMNSDSAGPRAQAAPVINVTPLIDVLLVLLIIFMVLTPLRPSRFKALVPEEPRRTQPPPKPNPLTLVVAVDRGLRLKVNGSEFVGTTGDASGAARFLAEVFERRRKEGTLRQGVADPATLPEDDKIEKTVFVKAPRSISYGEVARVIDAIKGAGANPVGLQIDELEP
jgi:biopolymer transport protein ExbD